MITTNHNFRNIARAGVAVLGLTLSAGAASGASDRLTINAQYRGGIKQRLGTLGTAEVSYSGDERRFTVTVRGSIRHPKEDRAFEFGGVLEFEVAGGRLTLGKDTLRLNAAAEPHREKFLALAPFLYLARYSRPPLAGGDGERRFLYRSATYRLMYGKSEKQVEVSLFAGDDSLGKFFLSTGWAPGREGFEKFRLFLPEEGLAVSFVVD